MAISNFLQWGAEFLYADTALYTDVDLLIGKTGETKVPITGSMTHTTPLLDANKVKITQERFMFLIDRVLLEATGIRIQRGVEITMNNEIYEVVLDAKGSMYNNDPSQLRKTIVCVKKEVET